MTNFENGAAHSTHGEAADTARVRGYWIAQAAEFLRHHFQTDVRQRLEDSFSTALTSALGGHSLGDWVRREHLVELLRISAEARAPGTDAFADLAACGAFIEHRAGNRFTELLMKIMTPELFVQKLPQFWQRDHGRFGRCVVEEVAPGRGRFRLQDVAEFTHIGPVWLGWVRAGLGTLRAESLNIRQSGWTMAAPSPARIEFEVSWS
ncbi:MAG: hypothetical protein ACOY0T_14030 [Myxococcota bacterium]